MDIPFELKLVDNFPFAWPCEELALTLGTPIGCRVATAQRLSRLRDKRAGQVENRQVGGQTSCLAKMGANQCAAAQ